MAKTIFLFVQPLQSNVHVLEVKIDEFSRQYSAFSKMVEFSAKRHGKSKKWWESEEKDCPTSATRINAFRHLLPTESDSEPSRNCVIFQFSK